MKNVVFWDVKTPVRASHETHYVSTGESGQLMRVIFVISTAVTMKNVVFWDLKSQFVPHRRHITSLLQRSAG
jgi:hypothetical protein